MKDTSLVTDGSSCTRSGGRPDVTEARKVKEAEGAPRECGMSEKNATNAKRVDLLEKILDSGNLQRAYDRVCANKGSAGVDGIGTDELLDQLDDMGIGNLKEQIRKGKYRPKPVLRVEIPKEGGKTRNLGIPRVLDRMVQQAIAQVLSEIYEPEFCEYSYGFRPKRGAHDALRQSLVNADEGYVWVVDMDLERFFDTVNHSKLIQVLSEKVKDGRVVSLVHKFLRAGVVVNGTYQKTEIGCPQGGNLSPILANILLNECDQELNLRGHRFVRYADDLVIFCRSRKAAERTLNSTVRYLEKVLKLKVNREKTSVSKLGGINFLGYGFFYNWRIEKWDLRLHEKSQAKLKAKLKELTQRSNGWSLAYRQKRLNQLIRGWVAYFKLAKCKRIIERIDQWLRRRIRMLYWKMWKRIRTRYRNLRRLGVEHQKAYEWSNSRLGYWRVAGSWILSTSLGDRKLYEMGWRWFSGLYARECVN
ncbi:MAG TPA: group II intron reverse transcriptase/maturase [Sphaerochaeta sp.]|nr:group II intron reverse transcriptase/maturase [Sphaerochaeta sp.]